MQLFIMRHGEADVFAASDQKRELTDKGRAESLSMVKIIEEQIKQQNQQTSDELLDLHVIVSPYIRAQQTWQVLESEWVGIFNMIHSTVDSFMPNGQCEACIDYLNEYVQSYQPNQPKNLLIISHLPLVNYLTLDLLQKNRLARFSTATVAALDIDLDDDNPAQLLWMKSPH